MTTPDNLTQMSLTMPDTAATEPDVTPAVRRSADVLFAAEVAGLILDDIRAGLAAALKVDEMARALYDHEYHMGRTWDDAPDWMQATFTERATALRAAIVGEA